MNLYFLRGRCQGESSSRCALQRICDYANALRASHYMRSQLPSRLFALVIMRLCDSNDANALVKSKKLILITAVTLLSVTISSPSLAAIITITSSDMIVQVNDVVHISFDITDLSGNKNDSLGGFDIDVTYDQSVLKYQSSNFLNPVTSNNQLELPELSAFSFFGDVSTAGGIIDAFGLSGNSSSLLDSQQLNSFVFLNLDFIALSAAITSLSIDLVDPNLVFSNPEGGTLPVFFKNSSINIQVAGINPIPSPNILSLILIGSFSMFFCLRVAGRE